ncbi:MAG TPA: M56 family metallopeptidase [Bryobacteraceae bacterium]|nr:M56 family metallopeptidase [Bryobacteraceae bacterium]
MIPGLLNHLWQSTLFAGGAALLTLLLRRNRARTRYWIWLAASVKFLIPFSLLVQAGSYVGWRDAPAAAQPPFSYLADQVFTAPVLAVAPVVARPHASIGTTGLLVAWFCGFSLVLFKWWRQWRRVRLAVRTATPLRLDLPIRAVSSPALLEPGVFGVFRPVLLLPEGIGERLTPRQMEAIVAHELCHVRYHDNLAAAVHMLVEAVFWFHPLVWWIGGRLVDERELACDQEVLGRGSEPHIYAEGILKVCEHYLESPLACVAGVTGSNLRKRIRGIMTHRAAMRLDAGRKWLLALAGTASIAGPLIVGAMNAPQIRAQEQTGGQALAFDVAVVKPTERGKGPSSASFNPQGVEYHDYSVRMLIAEAYGVKSRSISATNQGDRILLDGFPFDIVAKTDHNVPKEQLQRMMQSLLADRFKVALRREAKTEPVYNLVVAKNGPKMQDAAGQGQAGCALGSVGGAVCRNITMAAFSNYLSDRMGRVVLDQTGLTGRYDFDLKLDGTPGLNEIRESMAASGDPGVAKRSLANSLRDWTGTSIYADIQKQLGLKLEAGKATVGNLVVQHVEKPSEN